MKKKTAAFACITLGVLAYHDYAIGRNAKLLRFALNRLDKYDREEQLEREFDEITKNW